MAPSGLEWAISLKTRGIHDRDLASELALSPILLR